jgi:hypothetical protein
VTGTARGHARSRSSVDRSARRRDRAALHQRLFRRSAGDQSGLGLAGKGKRFGIASDRLLYALNWTHKAEQPDLDLAPPFARAPEIWLPHVTTMLLGALQEADPSLRDWLAAAQVGLVTVIALPRARQCRLGARRGLSLIWMIVLQPGPRSISASSSLSSSKWWSTSIRLAPIGKRRRSCGGWLVSSCADRPLLPIVGRDPKGVGGNNFRT